MKKLTLGAFAMSLVLGGVAHAHDDGNLPPPPNGELEGIKLAIQSQCGVSEEVGDEKIECMIGALHSLKENGDICEEAFRFLLREFELRYAYFRGKKDAELNCGGGEQKPPPPPSEGGGSDKKKVEICHIPPGNPDNAHTIRVSQSAVDAHLAHGDTLGACADDDSNSDNKKEKEKNKDKDKKNKKDKEKNKKGNNGKKEK